MKQKLTINLMVKDTLRTQEFYKNILGFNTVMSAPNDQQPQFIMMANEEMAIMFHDSKVFMNKYPELENEVLQPSVSIIIETEDFDGVFEKAREEGIVIREKQKTFYGSVEFSMIDPSGYVLTIIKC